MKKKKLLIISVSGIGNTILQSPFINAILASGLYETDILFGSNAIESVYRSNSSFRKKYILPASKLHFLSFLWELRMNCYDYCVNCFPSNRIEFAILQFFINAKIRLSHFYSYGKLRTLSFVYNEGIDAIQGIHDVEQNLNLLNVLGVRMPEKIHVTFDETGSNKLFAESFIKTLRKDRKTLGIHPGSGPLLEKRWPVDRFLKVIEALKDELNIVVFGNSEETSLFQNLSSVLICLGDLNDVAAVIGSCDYFLSADTGLMHIASVFRKKQFVLWGPTSFVRTRPWNENSIYFGKTNLDMLRYPFGDTKSRFHGEHPEKYMEQITVEEVIQKIRDSDRH